MQLTPFSSSDISRTDTEGTDFTKESIGKALNECKEDDGSHGTVVGNGKEMDECPNG